MSGTKACDVSSPLTKVEQYEDNIIGNNRKFTYFNNSIDSSKEKITSGINKVKAYSLDDIDIIKAELPEKMEILENSLSKIRQTISNFKYPDKASVESAQAKLSSQIKECNKHKIAIKSDLYRVWGFNSGDSLENINKTYNDISKWIYGQEAINIKNRAENLHSQMSKIKKNQEKLVKEVDALDKSFSALYNDKVHKNISNLEDLEKEIINLRKEAKNIQKIRNEANALKDDIEQNIETIDVAKAKKFLAKEFDDLNKSVASFKSQTNEAVIKQYSSLSTLITKLKFNSEEAYNAWFAEKRHSEYLLEKMIEKGEQKEISLIDELLENGTKKIANFTYFDKYNKTAHQAEFNNLISDAKSALTTEQFNKCNNILNKANDLYYDIESKTSDLKIKLESEMNLVLKMRDIMEGLGFDKTELDFINDDVMNGFYLNCQNGDTINFEEIRFKDNGELIVNLDHTVGTGEGCGVRWAKMQKVFNQNGIALMDVTKNGASVITGAKNVTKKVKPPVATPTT